MEEPGQNPVIDRVQFKSSRVWFQNDRQVLQGILGFLGHRLDGSVSLRGGWATLGLRLYGALATALFFRGLAAGLDQRLVAHFLGEGGGGGLAVL